MTAQRRPINDAVDSLICNTANVADGALLVQDAANDYAVTRSAIASPTPAQESFVGIAKTSGATIAAGSVIDVVEVGIYPGIAGGTITRGNLLTSNGDGTLIVAAPAAGTNVWVIGRARQSAVAGQLVTVLINPFVLQG